MDSVIIISSPGNKNMTRQVTRVLTSVMSGILVSGNSARSFLKADKPPRLLMELEQPENLTLDRAVLIFDSGVPAGDLALKGRFVAVTASDNHDAIKLLKKKKIPTLICGMSSKDTVSLSSRGEGSACVCLQRGIESLSGEAFEPGEIAVKYKGELSEYAIMAAAVTLVLCGALPEGEVVEFF